MKTKITIEQNCEEPWLEIHAGATNEKILALAEQLGDIAEGGEKLPTLFSAWNGGIVTLLKPESICRFFSLDKKVWAESGGEKFLLKRYLYEIEKILIENNFTNFFRISNSEIVNFDFIKNLDMTFSGVIHINFKDGQKSLVSRRFTSKICKRLQIK